MLLLAGCQPVGSSTVPTILPPPSAPASSAPSPTGDPIADARADLDLLLEELEAIHPEPFHGVAREAWLAARDELADRLPELTPVEAVVELQRLFALLSLAGRDGHQFAFPLDDVELPVLPIRVHEFAEGLFITAARDDESLVGARIDAVAGRPIADVLAAVEPLVPRDGPATVPLFRPVLFLRTSVLRGLGIAGEGDVPITVTLADGASREASLAPMEFPDYVAWATAFGMFRLPPRDGLAYLQDLDRPTFGWEYRTEDRLLYVRFTQVRPTPQAELEALRERATADDVDRVIVDMRQNPGGDNTTYPPILNVLRDPAIDREGRLFVLTDRVTFSAASNFSTELEQTTSAIFAGEPMGGGLNFWNDVRWVRLEHWPIPMQVGISTRYWQKSVADDPRLTIEPDIPVTLRAADYFAGVDATLAAVLAAD